VIHYPYQAHRRALDPDGSLPVAYVLDHWRPGSFDRDWAAEFADLGSRERIGEMLLRTWDEHGQPQDELPIRMLRGEPIEPVTLGWDGRVWAGHHRLWLFFTVGWLRIPSDVVEPEGRRGWPACHCAPPEGWLGGPGDRDQRP
jgi:hypothetical protein